MKNLLSGALLTATLGVTAAAAEEIPVALAEALGTLVPGATVEQLSATPLPGLYELVYNSDVLYLSADGRYVIQGDLLDLTTRQNLTEEARKVARLAVLENMGEETMIVFAPEEVKYTVTVFTDIDCPYCVRLHREVEELNDNGIKVRYLAFPRAGIPSSSYDKTVSVWCADDTQQAITDAKFGKAVEPRECENPVAEHFSLGRDVGVRGTPTLIMEDGGVIPGYVPAAELIQMTRSPDS